MDFKSLRRRHIPQRRQHFLFAIGVPEPIKVQQAHSNEFQVRHGGDDAPGFFPGRFVVWGVECGVGEEEGLRDGVVDGPGHAPFDVEGLDKGEAVG